MDQCQVGCLSFCRGGDSWAPIGNDDVFDLRSSYLMTQGASTPIEAPAFENHPSPQAIDSLMAKELASMSLKERERVENDVHGIGDDVEDERPTLLDDCLAEMNLNLDEMKTGTAYELAEKMNKGYVTSRDFRAMFIRADRWDTWEASERMIRFFELKRQLFGDEKLVKDIHLEDLDDDDMDSLRAGHHQLSPHKDSAGRLIVAGMLALRRFKSVENIRRAVYYMYMSATENIVSQRKGVTLISYSVDYPPTGTYLGDFRRAIPLHLASHHFCYNDPASWAMGTITVAKMTPVQRARFRRHFGNHLECLYKLKSYGIPENSVPVTTAGELLTTYHMFWLETRRSMEQTRRLVAQGGPLVGGGVGPTLSSISTTAMTPSVVGSTDKDRYPTKPPLHDPSQPGRHDVVLGRSKAGQDHPGNLVFREFIDKSMKNFENGTKSEKMALTQVAVDLVKAAGGRFMVKEGSKGWEEVGYGASARKRVAAYFKIRRKVSTMRPAMAPAAVLSY